MPVSTRPRYLTAAQASSVRLEIGTAVDNIRAELEAEGADPACFDHEIAMALVRYAASMGLDMTEGAAETIARLEAQLETARIAGKARKSKRG